MDRPGRAKGSSLPANLHPFLKSGPPEEPPSRSPPQALSEEGETRLTELRDNSTQRASSSLYRLHPVQNFSEGQRGPQPLARIPFEEDLRGESTFARHASPPRRGVTEPGLYTAQAPNPWQMMPLHSDINQVAGVANSRLLPARWDLTRPTPPAEDRSEGGRGLKRSRSEYKNGPQPRQNNEGQAAGRSEGTEERPVRRRRRIDSSRTIATVSAYPSEAGEGPTEWTQPTAGPSSHPDRLVLEAPTDHVNHHEEIRFHLPGRSPETRGRSYSLGGETIYEGSTSQRPFLRKGSSSPKHFESPPSTSSRQSLRHFDEYEGLRLYSADPGEFSSTTTLVNPVEPKQRPESVGKSADTSEPSLDGPPGKKRRRKTEIACHFCRLRKLRCDGEKPCVTCRSRENPCTYEEVPRRRGPGKQPKGSRKTGKARNSSVPSASVLAAERAAFSTVTLELLPPPPTAVHQQAIDPALLATDLPADLEPQSLRHTNPPVPQSSPFEFAIDPSLEALSSYSSSTTIDPRLRGDHPGILSWGGQRFPSHHRDPPFYPPPKPPRRKSSDLSS